MGMIEIADPQPNKTAVRCEARGTIKVPVGKVVILEVSRAASRDLSPLGALQSSGLDWLRFPGAPISPAQLVHIRHLASLKHLYLRDCQITDEGASHLGGLTSLKFLDLRNCGITDAGMAHLKGLVSLQMLYLQDAGITDQGLAELRALTSLTMLSIRGSCITETGIAHLKNALPRLAVSTYHGP
jgi:Leucine-rich repeat (LRR) protein